MEIIFLFAGFFSVKEAKCEDKNPTESQHTSGLIPGPCGSVPGKMNLDQLSREWISPSFLLDTAEIAEGGGYYK